MIQFDLEAGTRVWHITIDGNRGMAEYENDKQVFGMIRSFGEDHMTLDRLERFLRWQ